MRAVSFALSGLLLGSAAAAEDRFLSSGLSALLERRRMRVASAVPVSLRRLAPERLLEGKNLQEGNPSTGADDSTSVAECADDTVVQVCSTSGGDGAMPTETTCTAFSSVYSGPVKATTLCHNAEKFPVAIAESGGDWQEGSVSASCECGNAISCTCHSPWTQCPESWWYPQAGSATCSQFVPDTGGRSKGAKIYAVCNATCPEL